LPLALVCALSASACGTSHAPTGGDADVPREDAGLPSWLPCGEADLQSQFISGWGELPSLVPQPVASDDGFYLLSYEAADPGWGVYRASTAAEWSFVTSAPNDSEWRWRQLLVSDGAPWLARRTRNRLAVRSLFSDDPLAVDDAFPVDETLADVHMLPDERLLLLYRASGGPASTAVLELDGTVVRERNPVSVSGSPRLIAGRHPNPWVAVGDASRQWWFGPADGELERVAGALCDSPRWCPFDAVALPTGAAVVAWASDDRAFLELRSPEGGRHRVALDPLPRIARISLSVLENGGLLVALDRDEAELRVYTTPALEEVAHGSLPEIEVDHPAGGPIPHGPVLVRSMSRSSTDGFVLLEATSEIPDGSIERWALVRVCE